MNRSLFRQFLLLVYVAAWALPLHAYNPNNREEYLAKVKEAEAYYKKKCETVAGIKIHKTVPDVEGLLLMKIRPNRGDRELADRNWPGAAFGRESSEDGYITSFLGSEHREPDSKLRGYINTDKRPGGFPGYRWVEVIDAKDGQRYRCKGRWEEPWQKDKNWLQGYIKFYLDKAPSPSPTPPRFGVTFEDHVIPEERYLGVASSTIKVIDLQTKEVLGELIRYAWSPGAPSRVNPSPWLTAYRCPDHSRGTDAATRKFVDQILIPAKEK